MNNKKDDLLRRVKILFVDYHEVLSLLNPWKHSHVAQTINHEELPEDFTVISVHNNHEMRGFDLLISHPSFDIVKCGAMPSRLVSLERVQVLYKVEKV